MRLRGCYYDPARGLGIFGSLKPAISDDEDDIPDASIGLRYSTSRLSAGIAVNPLAESCKQIWVVSPLLSCIAALRIEVLYDKLSEYHQ